MACSALFRRLFAACALVAFAAAHPAFAAWPEKPIRMIVPWPAGGGSDVVARIVSKKLADHLGQPIVIDNRAGATGLIGTEAAVKAEPDGYTIVFIADSYLVSPHVSPKVTKYDVSKDFTEVGLIGFVPFVLVVNAEKHPGNLAQFVEKARKPDSALTFSSWGIGSSGQMAMEMFKGETGAKLRHIPFQGAAPAMNAVLAGHVDAMFVPAAVALPHHRTGKARILGVSAKNRFVGAPDLPTLGEQGVNSWMSWMGIMGPARMPPDVVAKLNAGMKAAIEDPEVREGLIKAGVEPTSVTPAELSKFVRSEYDRIGKIVRAAGVTVD